MNRTGFPAEYARLLLDEMHNDPAFNQTWGVFWATQPGPEGVFTPEVRRGGACGRVGSAC